MINYVLPVTASASPPSFHHDSDRDHRLHHAVPQRKPTAVSHHRSLANRSPCRSPPPSPRASAPAAPRPRPRGGAPTPGTLCLSPRAAAAAPRPAPARPFASIPRRRGSSAPCRRRRCPDRVAAPRPTLLLPHPHDRAVEARLQARSMIRSRSRRMEIAHQPLRSAPPAAGVASSSFVLSLDTRRCVLHLPF